MMPALLSLFATNKICQGCQNWPKKKHDSWHRIWIPYISQRGTYFFQTILSVGKFQYPSIGFELLFSMSFLHEFVPFCSFTSSISPKQHHLTPYPLCHVTMSEKKNEWFCLHHKWLAQWVNSWLEDLSEKLEALETTATEKLKDLSDTSGALATKVRRWMDERKGWFRLQDVNMDML